MRFKLSGRKLSSWLTVFAAVGVVVVATGCGSEQQKSSAIPGDVNAGAAGKSMTTGATGSTGQTGDRETSSGHTSGPTGTAELQAQAEAQTRRKEKQGFKGAPPPTPLWASTTSGARVSKPTVVAASSQSELKRLLLREERGNPTGGPTLDVPFSKGRQVWAIFLPKSPAGTQVSITSVRSNGRKVRVVGMVTEPAEGCKTSGGATHPTAWVETARFSGTPELALARIKQKC